MVCRAGDEGAPRPPARAVHRPGMIGQFIRGDSPCPRTALPVWAHSQDQAAPPVVACGVHGLVGSGTVLRPGVTEADRQTATDGPVRFSGSDVPPEWVSSPISGGLAVP